MTFAAAWTISSEPMAVVTLDAASQTGAPAMVYPTTNLGARMAKRHSFGLIQVLCTVS